MQGPALIQAGMPRRAPAAAAHAPDWVLDSRFHLLSLPLVYAMLALRVLVSYVSTFAMARQAEPIAIAGGTGADPLAFPHDWHRSVIADFSRRTG